MRATPLPFDAEASLGSRRTIIRRNPDRPQEIEMIEAHWGSDPRFSDGLSYKFARAEAGPFPAHRCLTPASEFHVRNGDRHFRVRFADGNFFYVAGLWEPAMDGWSIGYRIITVDANLDVIRYQERHGAIILRRQVMHWLDHSIPEADLLVTPPAQTFAIEEIFPKPVQMVLAL